MQTVFVFGYSYIFLEWKQILFRKDTFNDQFRKNRYSTPMKDLTISSEPRRYAFIALKAVVWRLFANRFVKRKTPSDEHRSV